MSRSQIPIKPEGFYDMDAELDEDSANKQKDRGVIFLTQADIDEVEDRIDPTILEKRMREFRAEQRRIVAEFPRNDNSNQPVETDKNLLERIKQAGFSLFRV